MAKKKKTLPKDFEQLLIKGDLEALKAIFNTTELEAYGGYSKETALAYDKCPHELAKWLVEQGANLQAVDHYGYTPLHSRSRSIFGNIKSLLELGADVHSTDRNGGTPLHQAADGHNPPNTALLLEYGARIDTRNTSGLTPWEQALRTCSNIDIINTATISRLYLDAGATISPAMKGFVTEIGKQFEFHRAGFSKAHVNEVSDALHDLYKLFDVEPVPKRAMHDGKSRITIQATSWQDQHQELWKLLVPSSGPAETMQGEVIRIAGRISRELDGNGGINWDADFKKMADTFLAFIQQGKQFPTEEEEELKEIIQAVKRKSGYTDRLCELAVQWVIANPVPIKRPEVDYKR